MTYSETLNMDFVDIMGSGYVIDHCISAFQQRQEEKLFRVYITDALKAVADNTMRFAGGYEIKKRFFDLAYDRKKPEETTETADQIILRIRNKLEGLCDG